MRSTGTHTGPPRPKRRTGARPYIHTPRRPADRAHAANTRETLLDTAEQLFAKRGVAATSVRDITGAAGANLGAINYHFGTKQELVLAVFSRRIFPVAERQLALLDNAERKTGGEPPRLEALLEAMIRPSVEQSFAEGKRNTAFMRLIARCLSEPNPEVKRWVQGRLQKVMARFVVLVERARPNLSHEEALWRTKFTLGALVNTLQTTGQEGSLPPDLRKGLDAEALIRRLVAFTAAGMRAGT
jgi:AcrR family transcriptional regulator